MDWLLVPSNFFAVCFPIGVVAVIFNLLAPKIRNIIGTDSKNPLDYVKFLPSWLRKKVRRCTEEEYKKWIEGFMQSGGKVTASSTVNPGSRFFVATEDLFFEHPLCGTDSISIIVPTGIKFLGGDFGHCDIFYADGYKTNAPVVHNYTELWDKQWL